MKPISVFNSQLPEEIMKLTIKDIAKLSGVSQTTVSRVINNPDSVKEETRKIVEQVISENHYSPNAMARGLSKNESNTIGVIVPDISNPFFCEVIKGISAVADQEDLKIILYDTDENPRKEVAFLENIEQQKLKGIIITPISDSNEFDSEFSSLLEGISIPIILVDRDVKYSNLSGVFIDNIKGAFDATSALINEGHKSIAIIAGPKTSKPGRDRLRGYMKAFEMNNIQVSEDLIYYGDFRFESGYEIAKKILKSDNRTSAIFSCNNLMTLGVLKAIRELNLESPRDVALIGFDEIAYLDIMGFKISYVSRSTYNMGRIAMEILLEQLNSNQEKKDNAVKSITLLPKLVLQGSEKLNS
jgi:LacI family transcriptional regulator